MKSVSASSSFLSRKDVGSIPRISPQSNTYSLGDEGGIGARCAAGRDRHRTKTTAIVAATLVSRRAGLVIGPSPGGQGYQSGAAGRCTATIEATVPCYRDDINRWRRTAIQIASIPCCRRFVFVVL